jgi:heterodisulfide reductase subunit B
LYSIPILYVTELLALAMGYSADEIGLKFHRTRRGTVIENL